MLFRRSSWRRRKQEGRRKKHVERDADSEDKGQREREQEHARETQREGWGERDRERGERGGERRRGILTRRLRMAARPAIFYVR